jgi:hypothetical protein
VRTASFLKNTKKFEKPFDLGQNVPENEEKSDKAFDKRSGKCPIYQT